jgi:carbamoyltransferase
VDSRKAIQKHVLRDHLRSFDPDFDARTGRLFTEHYLSHPARYPSPFSQAAALTMDRAGECATTSVAVGNDAESKVMREIYFPHSLGLLYSAFTAFTYYTGFKVNSGEYKVMGLAPYGEPRYSQRMRDTLIDLKEDGSYRAPLRRACEKARGGGEAVPY